MHNKNRLQSKDTIGISMLVVSDEFEYQYAEKFATVFAVDYLSKQSFKQIILRTKTDDLTAMEFYEKC